MTVPAQGPGPRKQQACGVIVHPVDRPDLPVHIRAGLVVAAAGSLHNPALLLRGGITCRGNVGKNLHLHCGAAIAARFPKKVFTRQDKQVQHALGDAAGTIMTR